MKTPLFKPIIASIIGLHISFLLMSQSIKVGMGTGVSAYFGDLTYTKQLFQQVSPSLSTDLSVDLNSRFGLRLNIAYTQLQADDKKSIYWPTRNRNLNFKSDVLEISTLAEFDIFKSENVMVTPYLFGGPGIFLFNPTTIDRYGNKVELKYVGTEGQPGTIALSGDPTNLTEGTKMPIKQSSKAYETNALCLTSGIGLRLKVSELFSIGAEFAYRFTNTDMLDDVSANQYPNKNLMNPYAYKLTFREDEIHPNAQPGYQPRGNPLIKDSYYTVQIRVTYQLN
ncbi:MAG: DUF6089 family protein [Sphingobacteriia bacterium]|jgi:hypothetical protein